MMRRIHRIAAGVIAGLLCLAMFITTIAFAL